MKRRIIKAATILLAFLLLATMLLIPASADESAEEEADLETPDMAQSMQLLILLTILALAPSIILMMTSFTRIAIVLSFVRNGLGLQQTPPNQVLVGLALFLSLFIMMPVAREVNEVAYKPYKNGGNYPDRCLSESHRTFAHLYAQADQQTGNEAVFDPFRPGYRRKLR